MHLPAQKGGRGERGEWGGGGGGMGWVLSPPFSCPDLYEELILELTTTPPPPLPPPPSLREGPFKALWELPLNGAVLHWASW